MVYGDSRGNAFTFIGGAYIKLDADEVSKAIERTTVTRIERGPDSFSGSPKAEFWVEDKDGTKVKLSTPYEHGPEYMLLDMASKRVKP